MSRRDFNRDQCSSSYGRINVADSVLTPLAREFVPAASSSSANASASEDQRHGGAVKRNSYYRNNRNRYDWKKFQTPKREQSDEENGSKHYWNKGPRNGWNDNRSGGSYYNKNYSRNDSRNFKGDSGFSKRNIPDAMVVKKKVEVIAASASQRERLEDMIMRRVLECLVCCEKLRHSDRIWSCKQCFHVMHLGCIQKWAQSSKLETAGWRCPACQNVYEDVPQDYLCYCGKQKEPDRADPGALPHSCGEPCRRKGRSCDHTCSILCHPGPCPECDVMAARFCGCRAISPMVKCSSTVEITCENICGKTLNCGVHECESKCHAGDCDSCKGEVLQKCLCGRESRQVKCDRNSAVVKSFECENVCNRLLNCGNHRCQLYCHAGDECPPCVRSPSEVTTCPCGKTRLSIERQSCLDPIPSCGKKCERALNCGQPGAPHVCQAVCHENECPPCPSSTAVRCRCGHMAKQVPCKELSTKADDARCEKKCTKKRSCGKHKCNQLCCIDIDHDCPLTCNRTLSCGQHRCELPCHMGRRCPPCWRTSFDELYCECGFSVLYPPVACGTRPPPCDRPCSRVLECGHDTFHTCHTGPCPPCTVLTKRWCHGKHEQRSTILCHQGDFSCGLPCGKPLPCGKHKCNQPCHKGTCKLPCAQPCSTRRTLCEHPCNQPCHEGQPCPETPCKQTVKVTCECGNCSESKICMDLTEAYHNIAMSRLASKMQLMGQQAAVDISDIVGDGSRRGSSNQLKILDCNEECRTVERNRRLAIGLQIRNPDLGAKLSPRYSDYMRGWAKRDPKFCQYVHHKLSELVQLAKQSKQKSRSFSFETMNREKRHFVHEYCEHFGCDSVAYDPEPNRNVVATAMKDRSWLPSYSLLEVIQRENGQRKVPGPQQLAKGGTISDPPVSLLVSWRANRPASSQCVD